MRTVDLGGVIVGDGQPCYVIAEIGINHNGSVAIAEKLVDAAAFAGAQAVKMQKRTVDVVYTKEQLDAPRESQWGSTVREQKYGIELGRQAYVDVARYARAKQLAFSASAWDLGALADVMAWVDPPFLKIASAVLTWEPAIRDPLLRAHAQTGKPLVMSTGMCDLQGVEDAIALLEDEWGGPGPLVLLACTSTYPAENHEINLRTMDTLRDAFGLPVGYSGHERGLQISVAAAARGACIIERHITLDRTSYGTDQAASVEPPGFHRLVRDIRVNELAMGSPEKRVLESELPIRAKLARRV